MLRDIINAWRSKGFMSKLFGEFLEMLEQTEWMFQQCSAEIFKESVSEEVQKEIYDRDICVNKAERRIRKELLTHLVVRQGEDIPGCLILMSICKDAERIGDYTKNLYEVRQMASGGLEGDFVPEMRVLCEEAVEMFAQTKKAFHEGDEELARKILSEESEFGKKTEELIREIAGTSLPASEAVAKAMGARFIKRILAHLGNIATSVIMPLHKLDYFDEDYLDRKNS